MLTIARNADIQYCKTMFILNTCDIYTNTTTAVLYLNKSASNLLTNLKYQYLYQQQFQ